MNSKDLKLLYSVSFTKERDKVKVMLRKKYSNIWKKGINRNYDVQTINNVKVALTPFVILMWWNIVSFRRAMFCSSTNTIIS